MRLKIRHIRRQVRSAGVALVAFAVAVAPVTASATQSGAQTSAGNTSNMASMLSSAIGVVSMAAGALNMQKGVEQLSCCTQGCSGAGSKASADKAATDKAAEKGASSISTPNKNGSNIYRSLPEFLKRFPDSASLDPRGFVTPQMRLQLMIDLFRPRSAQATGCTDALLAMATGGLMLLQGLMGMMTAQQAAKNANTSYGNAGGLGALDPYPGWSSSGLGSNADGLNGASGTSGNSMLGLNGADGSGGNGLGGSNGLGTDGANGGPGTTGNVAGNNDIANGSTAQPGIKIDPALLRTGKANDVMSNFEDKFGINRDAFANAVASGQDPRDILATAPKNPLSAADMNKATSAAQGMSDAEKSSALANAGLGDLQKDMAASLASADDNTYNTNGKSASRKPASTALDDLGLDPPAPEILGAGSGTSTDPTVSSDVKAALAQREDELSRKSHFDTSLFEVVHRKYKEKYPMISGAGVGRGQ